MTGHVLTRQEMILLHLLQYTDVMPNGYTMPFAQTQDGIAMAAGMSRSHVSNEVGILEEKGLVTWISTHPKGVVARRRAYYLLPPGLEMAKELRHRLDEMSLNVEDVIRRPGRAANGSPNIVMAMQEMEMACDAVKALMEEGDCEKLRSAVTHANTAVGHLLKEAM